MNSALQPQLVITPSTSQVIVGSFSCHTETKTKQNYKIYHYSSKKLMANIEKEVLRMTRVVEDIRATQLEQVKEIADIKGDIRVINTKLDTITSFIDEKKSNRNMWVGIIVTAVLVGLFSNIPAIISAFKSATELTP